MVTGTPPPALALTDLEAFDPAAPARGRERRFCCPRCGMEKPRDAAHRSLALNVASGRWYCHRCHAAGQLLERRQPSSYPPRAAVRAAVRRTFALPDPPPPAPEEGASWRAHLAGAVAVAGTPGAAYLERRGIPLDLATAAQVRYSPRFAGRPAVLFPLRDAAGTPVAVQGRYTDDGAPKARTVGEKRRGVFATPGALAAAPLVLTEAPLDALALAAAGVPALALCGTSWPGWLPRVAALRRVALAFDGDAAGEEAACKLAPVLSSLGARVERLRPAAAKDWNDVLQRHGAPALRQAWAAILEGTETPATAPLMGAAAVEVGNLHHGPETGATGLLGAATGFPALAMDCCAAPRCGVREIVSADRATGRLWCARHAPPADPCPDCGTDGWRPSPWGSWVCGHCLPKRAR